MNNPGRDQYARRMIVASSDMKQAARTCRLLLENVKSKEHPLFIPLLTAIVIMYARPFLENNGFGSLQGKWLEFTNPKFKEIHDTLMDLRHKVIAHSDSVGREVVLEFEDSEFGRRLSGIAVVSDSLALEIFPVVLEACMDLSQRLELGALEATDHLDERHI